MNKRPKLSLFHLSGQQEEQLRGEIRLPRVDDDKVNGGEAAFHAWPSQVPSQGGEEALVEAVPEEAEEHRGPGADFETGRPHQQHAEAAAGEGGLSW